MPGPMRVTRREALFPLGACDTSTWTKEAFRVVHKMLAAKRVEGDEGQQLARAFYMIATSAKADRVMPDDAVNVLARILLRVYQAGMLHAAEFVDDGRTGAELQAHIRDAARRVGRR